MKKHLKYFGVGLIFAALITVAALVIAAIVDDFDKHPRYWEITVICFKITMGILVIYLLGKRACIGLANIKTPAQQNTSKPEGIKYGEKIQLTECRWDPDTTELKCNKCGRVDVEWYNTQPGDLCEFSAIDMPCDGILIRVKKATDANQNNNGG